ncbi:sialidase family protein [Paraflavitalea devenefica]|uniref:sialidase family protein n=1 Tax=Paraflavitalea devenefica TaxID=2716334 RepID=UPI001FE4601C|nr:sialidase family protein [Paraflavitalea devenefica]
MKVYCIAAAFVMITLSSFGQDYKNLLKAIERQDQEISAKRVMMAPTIDLSQDTTRQTVVARGTDSIYQGHPTTVLLPNGKSILAVWTINHAGFCGPMKRSDDGGATWSDLLPVPESWRTVKNCPAIYELPSPSGKKTLFVFAGAGATVNQMHQSYSTDLGVTWSPMKPNGLGPASMPFCTIVPVNGGKKLIAMTNIRRPNETVEKKSCIIVKSESGDGGFTWSPWKVVLDMPGLKVCEPQIIRSPNGKQLLCLIRENAQRTSLYMTSDDEGLTWSEPKPVLFGLSGDRHQAKYTADGRLVIVFRDTGKGSPTRNHFVAWVGTYDDIVQNRKGQLRIKLLHSFKGGDCGYAGLEVLPDHTLVATTYIKYREGAEKNSVVSVRFKLSDL